jgi:hypothetical protein
MADEWEKVARNQPGNTMSEYVADALRKIFPGKLPPRAVIERKLRDPKNKDRFLLPGRSRNFVWHLRAQGGDQARPRPELMFATKINQDRPGSASFSQFRLYLLAAISRIVPRIPRENNV